MALGVFKVHAGDFDPKGPNQYIAKSFLGPDRLEMKVAGKMLRESIPLTDIAEVEAASEEAVTRIGGVVGWGTAGALLLGPAGLIAGALLGGKGKDVTFVCRLKDGRKFLATGPEKVFGIINAAAMANNFV